MHIQKEFIPLKGKGADLPNRVIKYEYFIKYFLKIPEVYHEFCLGKYHHLFVGFVYTGVAGCSSGLVDHESKKG